MHLALQKMKFNPIVKTILSLLLLCALVFAIYYLRTLLFYIVLSAILAFVGRPILDFLLKIHISKIRMPISIAAAIVLLLELGVFFGILFLFLPALIKELQVWSEIDTESIMSYLENQVGIYQRMAADFQIEFDSEPLKTSILNSLNLHKITGFFNYLAQGFGSFAVTLFSVSFITFFFLKEENLAPAMLYSAINQEHHEKLDRILPKVKNTLSRYFIGLLLQVSIVTVMVATGLSIVGIENIFFIAIFAGLINVIPYVGPLIGSSVGLILATAQNLNLPFEAELMPLIGMVALVFLITQMIDNFVLQPIIFSNSVNAHPLEIFLVITAAGTLLGVMGMIVAVPFYSLLRIIAKEFLSEFHIIQSLTRNV